MAIETINNGETGAAIRAKLNGNFGKALNLDPTAGLLLGGAAPTVQQLAAVRAGIGSVALRLKELFMHQIERTAFPSVSADVPTVSLEAAQAQPSAWTSPMSAYRFIRLQLAGVKTKLVELSATTKIGLTGAFNDGQSFDFLQPNLTGGGTGPLVLGFTTDAQVFGFCSAGGWGGQIYVDGKPASAVGYNLSGSGSSRYWVRVAFGSRKARNIVIVSTPGYGVGGLVVGNTDTVGRVPLGDILWAHEGDSYSQASTSNMIRSGIAIATPTSLGIMQFSSGPVGGSGYQARNSLSNALERIANITGIFDRAPDVVSVMLGINDQALSGNQAYVHAYYAALRAACPKSLIVATDPFCPVETNGTSYMSSVGQYIDSGVKAAGGDWILIHNIAGTWETSWGTTGTTGDLPWQTGTGKAGATTGTGNGDIYVDSGGTHLNTAGYDYLASRFYSALRAAILSAA